MLFRRIIRHFATREINAGPVNSLKPGSITSVTVDNIEHALAVYNVSGHFYATGGKCSHYKAPLSWGKLSNDCVLCPFHLASFHVKSGNKESAPGNKNLQSYECSVQGGDVIVRIPATGDPSAFEEPVPSFAKDYGIRKILIIGGGASGFACAETLRKLDYSGEIVMLTKEDMKPYDRVALSKDVTADTSKLGLRNDSFYENYQISVKTASEVKEVSLVEKTVRLSTGTTEHFDKLLAATGSFARLPRHYADYSSCVNVLTLRTAQDHMRLKTAIEHAKDIVIIGGSFLGLEAATSIRNKFPEKNVTIFELDKLPLARVMGETIGRALKESQENNHNVFKGGSPVDSLNTKGDRVASVTAANQTIAADLVLLATGAAFDTSYLPRALLNSDGSVRVSSLLQSDHSDVFATGDIAQFPGLLTGAAQRVEHWAVAQDHGIHAAHNMLGLLQPYTSTPFFWSNQFVNVQFTGYAGADSCLTETGADGSAYVSYLFSGERCIAVAACNWPGAIMTMKSALSKGLIPSKSSLEGRPVRLVEALSNDF